jgi:hypothetical protein
MVFASLGFCDFACTLFSCFLPGCSTPSYWIPLYCFEMLSLWLSESLMTSSLFIQEWMPNDSWPLGLVLAGPLAWKAFDSALTRIRSTLYVSTQQFDSLIKRSLHLVTHSFFCSDFSCPISWFVYSNWYLWSSLLECKLGHTEILFVLFARVWQSQWFLVQIYVSGSVLGDPSTLWVTPTPNVIILWTWLLGRSTTICQVVCDRILVALFIS